MMFWEAAAGQEAATPGVTTTFTPLPDMRSARGGLSGCPDRAAEAWLDILVELALYPPARCRLS